MKEIGWKGQGDIQGGSGVDSILAIKFQGACEPDHEDFLNTRSEIGLDFMVDFSLSIPWRQDFDDEFWGLD